MCAGERVNSIDRDDEHGMITVNDHGPGISEDQLPKIFDRFFQVDPSRTGAGSGLGLSIVSAACEESGGGASAMNNPTGGLAVSLSIPLMTPESTHLSCG
jgi:signal transduction histidine kinase